MGVIVYNGLSSKDFGLEVWQPPDYQIPERDYETIHVPGRDGDLVIDKESYKNTSRSYVVSFGEREKKRFTSLANKLAEWLHSASGYARLEDSYEPEYYRLALYQKQIGVTNIYEKAGYATIEFNCKPQRFLKSGERTIKFAQHSETTNHGYLKNPTGFDSRPIIKVFGTNPGNLTVGKQTIEITSINDYVVIDCELMEVYKEQTNCNSKIKLNGNGFPKLIPGLNKISFSGGITSVEVIPKWWTI